MGVLITTTVSVDAQKNGAQVTLHLVKGDAGTRRIMFVPISGGRQVDITGVVTAKVQAQSKVTGDPLLIDCTIENGKVYMVLTAALVQDVDEFECQLVMIDGEDMQLHPMPFTIIVHGTVYDGDAVEHTNTTVSAVYFDGQGRLTVELMDGTKLVADKWEHTHPLATDEIDGFMSKEDFTLLHSVGDYVNQDVKTSGTPRFEGLQIGWDDELQVPKLTIDSDGVITGLRFT